MKLCNHKIYDFDHISLIVKLLNCRKSQNWRLVQFPSISWSYLHSVDLQHCIFLQMISPSCTEASLSGLLMRITSNWKATLRKLISECLKWFFPLITMLQPFSWVRVAWVKLLLALTLLKMLVFCYTKTKMELVNENNRLCVCSESIYPRANYWIFLWLKPVSAQSHSSFVK